MSTLGYVVAMATYDVRIRAAATAMGFALADV